MPTAPTKRSTTAHAPYLRRDVTTAKGVRQHAQMDTRVARAAAAEPLGVGAEGGAVRWLQQHLNRAGYSVGTPNGRFNAATEAAVRVFQRKAGLTVTGTVDAKTWARLSRSYFAAESAVSPRQREREKSGAVLRTENLLKAIGYDVGKVDGLFTAATTRAVKRFQKKHDIEASGRVGSGTLNALVRAQWSAGSWKPGPGRLPGGDFSHWQSTALFNSVIRRSKWGAIKSTEGTGFVDPAFRERWRTMGRLQKQGKLPLRLAYHFLTPGNGVAQARHFLKTLGIKGRLQPGTRLVLDWEAAALRSPQTLRDAARHIHRVTGVWPMVYCSASNVPTARRMVPKGHMWMAKWDSDIPRNVPFVQFDDGPRYDHNVFNGNLKALRRFAGYPE